MKAEEIYRHVNAISDFFIEYFDGDTKLGGLVWDITPKMEDGRDCAAVDTALAVGFVVGNLFDATDPEILPHIDAIKRAFRKNGLLPFFPREKKAEATV